MSDRDFREKVQDLLMSKNGWVIGTGNHEDVNKEVFSRLEEKIKRHPILWAVFFMVA